MTAFLIRVRPPIRPPPRLPKQRQSGRCPRLIAWPATAVSPRTARAAAVAAYRDDPGRNQSGPDQHLEHGQGGPGAGHRSRHAQADGGEAGSEEIGHLRRPGHHQRPGQGHAGDQQRGVHDHGHPESAPVWKIGELGPFPLEPWLSLSRTSPVLLSWRVAVPVRLSWHVRLDRTEADVTAERDRRCEHRAVGLDRGALGELCLRSRARSFDRVNPQVAAAYDVVAPDPKAPLRVQHKAADIRHTHRFPLNRR